MLPVTSKDLITFTPSDQEGDARISYHLAIPTPTRLANWRLQCRLAGAKTFTAEDYYRCMKNGAKEVLPEPEQKEALECLNRHSAHQDAETGLKVSELEQKIVSRYQPLDQLFAYREHSLELQIIQAVRCFVKGADGMELFFETGDYLSEASIQKIPMSHRIGIYTEIMTKLAHVPKEQEKN